VADSCYYFRCQMSKASSANWPPRHVLETALVDVEARLSDQQSDSELRFDRARLLTALGRTDEARRAYLEILQLFPGHFGALNNLGVLLHSTGFRAAARTCYAQAVAVHPDNPMAHVNLGNILAEDEEWTLARQHYEIALSLVADHPEAHQGLANVLRELGEEAAAEMHRRAGYENRAMTTLPYRGEGQPISLLVLVSGTKGNIPMRSLLDDRVFRAVAITPEFYDAARALPPHQLIVNLIGDADLCRPALEAATRLVAMTTAPVLNHPADVLATGRTSNARRLGQIPDVIAPAAIELLRSELEGPDALSLLERHGLKVPFLLRSPGFHNGRHFYRVERALDLAAALSCLPGEKILVLQFLDARGADGKIRKYRVMMIDGELYPLHAAVAHDWKIHYVTAEMADFPEHRAEDEAFLHDMPSVLGPRAVTALMRISETLALDYAGIDFSLDAEGRILLFEANATMVVSSPEPDEKWLYRQAPVQKILDATRNMLVSRIA
jgi:hypothetical protein